MLKQAGWGGEPPPPWRAGGELTTRSGDEKSSTTEEGAIYDENKLYELLEAIARTNEIGRAQELLQKVISEYGLTHITYVATNLPTKKRARPLVATTYSLEWQKRYVGNRYMNIDPVVRDCLGRVIPIDWADVNREDPVVKKFFGEAMEFNVGPNGLAVPIRGRYGEFALLSVTNRTKKDEWEKTKRLLNKNILMFAYYFHDWALRVEGIDNNDYLDCLTTREKDCLKWRALGRSDWDISQLLSISERTVKFHLENARCKLGATNTTHAVTKALIFGLIAAL